jgi:integrase
MATIERRGPGQFRATIRRKGHEPQRRTFPTRALAEQWARDIESKIDTGEPVLSAEAARTTLHEALDRYEREITPGKRGARQERRRIAAWRLHPLARRFLPLLRGADLADYRDARRAGVEFERFRAARAAGETPQRNEDDPRPVGPDTVRLELAIIGNLYRIAATDWGMEGLPNPVKSVRKPAPGRARDRRLAGDEEARILAAAAPVFRQAIVIALETAMRRGELAALCWSDVDLARAVARVREAKSGEPRDVPLSPRALEALRALPRRLDGLVIGLTGDGLTQAWARAYAAAGVVGLRWHDLRHEAISRLFERGWSVAEVAAVSGHKTWTQLRRYTQLRAEALARKLAA